MVSQDILDRFWSKVDKISSPDGHWLWTGGVARGGYGMFTYRDDTGKRRNVRAHRFAYPLIHGEEVPPTLHVLHKPPCVNRRCIVHTYLGTQKDNWADTLVLGREASGEKNGTHTHPERVARGEHVNLAKLTTEEVLTIRTLSLSKGPSEIAALFGVGKSAISRIQLGKTWQHIPGTTRTTHLDNKGSCHGLARFTEAQVLDIRARYTGKRGEQAALAKEYGVPPATIGAIVRRLNWKHI